MYTTITERRKEIGILKSLGASTGFIIRAIEGEALLIGALGVVLGYRDLVPRIVFDRKGI